MSISTVLILKERSSLFILEEQKSFTTSGAMKVPLDSGAESSIHSMALLLKEEKN